jgi:RHS repeat-associated protein
MAYLYDGDGIRVGKAPASTPTQPNYLYWYGTGSQILEETDGAGNYMYEDYYFNGMLLARGEPDNWVDHFFADALGNTRCVYGDGDPDGGCSDYYPFGGERPIPSCCPTNPGGVNVPFMFTGKERDSESGLDNFGARYNSSNLGRFMSPDSTAYVKPINPQSWNLYAYAFNNPLLYIDPTGHTVSLANCKDQNECATLLGGAAQLPKGVTVGVDKKGNLELKGDLSKIKGGNALRLLQLVQSDKTANFSIGNQAPGPGGSTQTIRGGLSGTPSEGFSTSFSVVQADPSKVDSGDLSGVFLGKDGSITAGQIPGSDEEETAAHELLGHVWGELIGGQPAIVGGQANTGNLREALIAEDRVRNTDPSRGLKIRHQDSGQLVRTSDLPRITNPGSQP